MLEMPLIANYLPSVRLLALQTTVSPSSPLTHAPAPSAAAPQPPGRHGNL